MKELQRTDTEIWELIQLEEERQKNVLTLIASENIASKAVRKALGSMLTNKYAEGYPGRRYYAGNQVVDKIEMLACTRVKSLFGSRYANVQPHAGTPANLATYAALLNLKEKILSMDLAHGGHLSHGSAISFSGKAYATCFYGVDEKTGLIDMSQVRRIAQNERPRLIIAGGSAYPRKIDFKAFREIADDVGAFLLVDMAHIAGLVAAKVHPDPIPYADVVTSTTHKTLRGPRGAFILAREEFAGEIDKAVFPGVQGGPMEHVIAAKAVCFKEAAAPAFQDYQRQTIRNAQVLADTLQEGELKLISGGTDNHMMLADVTTKKLTGKEVEDLLQGVGIIVNKNMIPFDQRRPMDPSGIRIGTALLTSRGMKESEMKDIGSLILNVIDTKSDDIRERARERVAELCKAFPLYPN